MTSDGDGNKSVIISKSCEHMEQDLEAKGEEEEKWTYEGRRGEYKICITTKMYSRIGKGRSTIIGCLLPCVAILFRVALWCTPKFCR